MAAVVGRDCDMSEGLQISGELGVGALCPACPRLCLLREALGQLRLAGLVT